MTVFAAWCQAFFTSARNKGTRSGILRLANGWSDMGGVRQRHDGIGVDKSNLKKQSRCVGRYWFTSVFGCRCVAVRTVKVGVLRHF